MATEEKFKKQLAVAELQISEIEEFTSSDDIDDVKHAYEQVGQLINRLEKARDATMDYLVDRDTNLEDLKSWTEQQKGSLAPFRNIRAKLKKQMEKINDQEVQDKLKSELYIQQRVNEEQLKFQALQRKEREAAAMEQQKREEQWYMQKLEMEKQFQASHAELSKEKPSSSGVKLQKYTITPFCGDYKDWLRFWNQFMVEVDGSGIAKISKFNYLLELVKGKPREDILGLPHTEEGYEEAKRILKQNYGKDIKVHKALIRELEELPMITSIHQLSNIHDFYNKLARVVRTLVTMKKLTTAQSCVYTLIDKLGPVREILVQKDDQWEEWGLEELTENLRLYVERNPLREDEQKNMKKREDYPRNTVRKRDSLLFNKDKDGDGKQKRRFSCVYCNSNDHFSSNCTKVLSVASRKSILKHNKLCFNCTGKGHLASVCKSGPCKKCQRKHHTSLCEEQSGTVDPAGSSRAEKGLSSHLDKTTTVHGTVLAKVGTQTVRVMFDTGAGSSYICTEVITKQRLKPVRLERRCIEQMFGTMEKNVEIYNVTIESKAIEGFSLDVKCINAGKDVLTYLPNPNVSKCKQRFPRLRRLPFSEEETKSEMMPVHIILGAADYQRIRTPEPPVIGANPDQDPGAEFTKLGWTMYGQRLASEREAEKQFFLQSSNDEFEKLCSLDVLGISDSKSENAQLHEDFLQQLRRMENGSYETKLRWKEDHIPLPPNRNLSKARLESTVRKLERMGRLQEYDEIMQGHIKAGIIEPVPNGSTGEKVHYVPHRAVIRDNAETTKMRIVYDCSAKPNLESPSLNDCLKTGPPLQPLLFDILVRNRFKKYCVSGDIQKAFLQIWVEEQDRNAQRILWYNNLEERTVTDYRFTRVIFGATSSPYILGATLQKHVSAFENQYPNTTKSLLEDTYVDDIQGGGDTEEEATAFKEESTKILSKGNFPLHKWHSNVATLESPEPNNDQEEEQSYAESLVGGKRSEETKILGILWNKNEDKLSISVGSGIHVTGPLTKRKIISAINSIYDVLGWSAPITINAKIIFSEVCFLKLHWDEAVPDEVAKKWKAWTNGLTKKPTLTVPRCVVTSGQSRFEMHGFADASKLAVCAVTYVVCYNQGGRVDQNLLVAKSRVAPRNLSIPRLELVAAHTLAKLQNNVSKALKSFSIASFHNWIDSTTVLYWLANRGEWSTFVRNRVKKIQELTKATWKYVPTEENPSDLGTRGCTPDKLGETWFKGPKWIADQSTSPLQPEISETDYVSTERAKAKRAEVVLLAGDVTTEENATATVDVKSDRDWANDLLMSTSYWRLLRITAYVKRFIDGCRKSKKTGPLIKSELSEAERLWVRITQTTNEMKTNMELTKDGDRVIRCAGRIQGYNPMFIPRESVLARRIIEHCHLQTLHGGVGATMSKVRERFWIPRLRSLVKSVRHKCNHCKRFRAKAMNPPTTAALPNFRTEFTEPFSTTGVDFAGPLYYKTGKNKTSKAYVALFTCASTRAVHLSLCKEMTASEFKKTLKKFVARRGSPRLIVSDNAKTFKATRKWLATLANDDDLFNFLAVKDIEWRFNMSRSPWWGGFFERLVGIMKNSLSKAIGKALLKFDELEESLLDVEVFMNNRPLCYVGEDYETPVITPNILIHGQPTWFLEENDEELDEGGEMHRRLRYVKSCRQNVRKRWVNEYLHALQERFATRNNDKKQRIPGKNSVVLLKDAVRHRTKWRLGKVIDKIVGKDGVTRGFKIKTGNGYIIERPLQLVCDLEIVGTEEEAERSDGDNQCKDVLRENGESSQNTRKSPRKAKITAAERLVGVIANENEED